jgi:HemY protein
VSPFNGEIDAFEWKVPVAQLGAPVEMDDLNDLAEPLPEPEPELRPHVAEEEPVPADEAAMAGPVAQETPVDATEASVAAPAANGRELPHVPDDPGIEPEPVNEKKTFRLF